MRSNRGRSRLRKPCANTCVPLFTPLLCAKGGHRCWLQEDSPGGMPWSECVSSVRPPCVAILVKRRRASSRFAGQRRNRALVEPGATRAPRFVRVSSDFGDQQRLLLHRSTLAFSRAALILRCSGVIARLGFLPRRKGWSGQVKHLQFFRSVLDPPEQSRQ